jgi:naringenin degradation protein FdeD
MRSGRVAMNTTVTKLCKLDELPVDGARGFDPLGAGRDSLFVLRQGETLHAFRNVCPHQGASLPWRKDAYLNSRGTHIVCNAHGSLFDRDTGKCVSGPALGRSLDPVDVFVDDHGVVCARLN